MANKIDTKELIQMLNEPLFEFVTRACAIAYICQADRTECLEHVPTRGNVKGVCLLKFSLSALETFMDLNGGEAVYCIAKYRESTLRKANAFQDGFIAGQVSK